MKKNNITFRTKTPHIVQCIKNIYIIEYFGGVFSHDNL